MAQQNQASIATLINEAYANRTEDLRRNETRTLWNMFASKPMEFLNERGVRVRFNLEGNQSLNASSSNAINYAVAGSETYNFWTYSYKFLTKGVSWNVGIFETLNSADNSPYLVRNWMDLFMGAQKEFASIMDVYAGGDGSGALAILASDPDGTATTYTCQANLGVHRIKNGTTIQAFNPSTRTARGTATTVYTVTSVNQALNQFTTDVALPSAAAAGDLICVSDGINPTIDNVPLGIDGHISNSNSIYQGLDPTNEPKYKAIINDFAGEGLSYAQLIKTPGLVGYTISGDLMTEGFQGYNWIMSIPQYAALIQLGIPLQQVNLDANGGKMSPDNIGFSYSGHTIANRPIWVSRNILKNTIYFVDTSKFFRVSLKNLGEPQMAKFNGGSTSVLSLPIPASPIGNSTISRSEFAALMWAGNLCTSRRDVHVALRNIAFDDAKLPVSAG